jgi:hypothetical protein
MTIVATSMIWKEISGLTDTEKLGRFPRTRSSVYRRILCWLGFAVLSGGLFFYTIIIEPEAPVGSTTREFVAFVTPYSMLVFVAVFTLLFINCFRLLQRNHVLTVYKAGFTVEGKNGNIRSAYRWDQIHVTRAVDINGAVLPVGFMVLGVLLIFLVPVLLELILRGRRLRIDTADGKRYYVDSGYFQRDDLVNLIAITMSRSTELAL